MKYYKETQYEPICLEIFRKIGIKEGEMVLDFGCGKGTYTIPAAKIVGESGRVYAVDENKSKLTELSKKCQEQNLNNVEIVHTNGDLHLDFIDAMFDVVLLYDIFWYFPAGSTNLIKLLDEVQRISKNNVLISAYPEHTDTEKLKKIFIQHGLLLKNIYKGKVIHEDAIVNGSIYNFIKEGENV